MTRTGGTGAGRDLQDAWLERAALVAVLLLPLAFWPTLARPFSIPKLWLLVGLALLLIAAETVFAARPPSRPVATTAWADHLAWPVVAWLAAVGVSAVFGSFVSLEALALAVLPLPLFLAVRARQVDPHRLARVVAWSSIAVSVIAVMQWLGLDPLRSLPWNPDVSGSSRMRVYGTLGNPNFAAAWLCATLPLVAPRDAAVRSWRAVPFLLQLAAIVATGSRVLLAALPAMGAVLLLARSRARWWWLAALPAAVVALWLSPARPLGVTIAGRYDLARTAAAHLVGVPLVGYGPGSFEGRFAGWQAEPLREPGAPLALAPARPVDHAHNDYIEFWAEYGPLGLLAFLAVSGWLVVRAWPPASREGTASLAGAAALLAVALVDFPFHRPAEWTLLWMLLAAAHAGEPVGKRAG